MVKSAQKQLAAKPASKSDAQNGPFISPKSNFDADLHGEDGWVVVKKQRVVILVPSLSVPEKSSVKKPAPSQSQTKPGNLVDNQPKSPINVVDTRPKSPIETHPNIVSVDEQEKFLMPKPRRGQISGNPQDQHTSDVAKPSRNDFRMKPDPDRVGAPKLHKIHGVSNASKIIKRSSLMCLPHLLDGNTLLNQRLRATNLERKLQKAGGLSKWLASIGLGQFERIFQGKIISKFQLVNLTMEKLKDMGAIAVGPRRKLIHAIDCVCQPYCFRPP